MSLRDRLASLRRETDGTAAIEFGLVTPMLVIGLVFMIDLGLAIGERMELDRNVRAGVQAVMTNVSDLDAVRDFILSTSDHPDALSVAVNKACTCGDSAVDCTAWCAADEPPSVFIELSAVQNYEGIMLPPMSLRSATHVQLR